MDHILQNQVVLFLFGNFHDHFARTFLHRSEFFIFALVQIFPEGALVMLQIAAQIGEVFLFLSAFGLGQSQTFLFQKGLQIACLLDQFLNILLAILEFLFQFLLGLDCELRVAEYLFGIHIANFHFSGLCGSGQRKYKQENE